MASKHSDLDLMLHRDGELDAASGADIDSSLASDKHAKAILDSLAQVGDAVRTSVELEVDELEESGGFSSADLWARVQVELNEAEADNSAAEAVSASARESAKSKNIGFGAGFAAWIDRYRSALLTGAACTGAAALLLIALQSQRGQVDQDGVASPPGIAQQRPGQLQAPAQVPKRVRQLPAVLASEPAEVEDLEVFDGSGTVLTIPAETDGESSTTVIWITSEDMEGPI